MRAFSFALLLTVLCLALSAASFAADDATLYVVQGVPGRDVSATVNPGLPVDVLLNNEVCSFRGLTFPGNSGPLTLPAGSYDIKVSPANSLLPCSNPPEAETTVKLAAGGATTVALALSNGAPTLLTFADNLKTVPAGSGRLTIANATDAGTLQLTLAQSGVKNPKTRTFSLNSGQEITLQVPAELYTLQVTANGSTTPIFVGIVGAGSHSVELVYLVGSAGNNSVTLIDRIIRDVF